VYRFKISHIDDIKRFIYSQYDIKKYKVVKIRVVEVGDRCEWVKDENPMHGDSYDTSCNNKHIFIEGNIKENQHKFCPYCGREIKERTNG
jgi:uncharacterized Zn-finger protein